MTVRDFFGGGLLGHLLRKPYLGLGSVVVFAATMFALWRGVSNGSAAIVIVQAGIFAEASRQLVRLANCQFLHLSFLSSRLKQGCCSVRTRLQQRRAGYGIPEHSSGSARNYREM